ncbi:hypothetical protein SLA2020_017740 [Shorea laevis]
MARKIGEHQRRGWSVVSIIFYNSCGGGVVVVSTCHSNGVHASDHVIVIGTLVSFYKDINDLAWGYENKASFEWFYIASVKSNYCDSMVNNGKEKAI